MFGGRYSAFTAASYEINFEALLMLAVSLKSIRKSFTSSGRILRLAAESPVSKERKVSRAARIRVRVCFSFSSSTFVFLFP